MLPALLGTCSAAHHELPVKALPSRPEDVPTTPCTCIQNSVLQIRPCLSQLSEARLCRAVPCYAVLTTDFLFQVPLLAHESITEPAFDSATQALVFHLKCRWRTELHSSLSQNSPVQHCSPQMMGNFCLRPCLSAISIFFSDICPGKGEACHSSHCCFSVLHKFSKGSALLIHHLLGTGKDDVSPPSPASTEWFIAQ